MEDDVTQEYSAQAQTEDSSWVQSQVAQVVEQPDAWYVRAGRSTKRFVRRAVLPTLIAVGMGTCAYGGFESGRAYQRFEQGGLLEETIMEDSVERSVKRRGGKLYLHERIEKNRSFDIEMMRGQGESSADPYITIGL